MFTVIRVHFALLVLSLALFNGCTTMQPPAPKPVYVNPASSTPVPPSKIIRFADALGAVSLSPENAKLQSMIAAFDYCDREQRLAFVTPPLSYSRHINYSRVSTYSNRLSDDPSAQLFVAPFECIDQKHSVKTGLLESEDIPSFAWLQHVTADSRGGVIVHRVSAESKFQENDIVVKVGDFRIENRAELVKAVDVSSLGPVEFTVVRGGHLIQVSGEVLDKTMSASTTALKLLESLCKETGSSAPSCARHAFVAGLSAKN